MKINAIRLAEFGRFAEPVAIEGLSGRLNVLAGPNELGKSTLLAALRAGFFTSFGSQKKEVKELRPYGGGAPTVEIEFELELERGLRRYRLRKRFLSQPSAELRDLSGGLLLRGPEAEAELARLTGGPGGDGRFRLAWVNQRGTLEPLAPAGLDDGLPSLHRALAREVEAAAAGGRSKQVHGEVRRLLAEVMGGHGGTRARGAYDAASKGLKAKSVEHAKAEADLALAQQRIEQLGILRAAETVLGSATATADRKARIETARTALETARTARGRYDVLAEALKAAEGDLAQKRRSETEFERSLAELAALVAVEVQLGERRAAEETRVQTMTVQVSAGRQQLDGLRRHRESLDCELSAARAAERLMAAAAQAEELLQRQRSAQDLAARCRELRAILTASKATPDVLKAATHAAAGIRENEARLQAAAPVVVIDYLPGAEGSLQVGGRPIGQGETLLATTPLIIEIAGIGRISVAPGGGAALAGTQAVLDAHREALTEHLATAGAVDLAALEAAVEQRRSTETAHAEAATRLAALAPDGLDVLRQRCNAAMACAGEAGEVAVEASRPSAVIEAEIIGTAVRITELERTLDPAGRELSAVREALAAMAGEAETLRRRRNELVAALPSTAAARTAFATELAAAVADAAALVNRTVRDLAAWADQVPDAAALDVLQKACASADATERTAGAELARLRTEAARLEGALAEARNEDIELRAANLGQEVRHLEAEVRRFAEDVAVLQLLDRELAAEEARNREQFLAPVMARLGPYLDSLFPAAQVSFDEALAPDGIERLAGQSRIREQLERTSDGTQEQIAVLVRLAFARLFADSGTAVPLILDDALVYADDQRIAAMFRALEQAAETHQVIVLTCRTQSFEGLRGKRLTLAPWSLAQAA